MKLMMSNHTSSPIRAPSPSTSWPAHAILTSWPKRLSLRAPLLALPLVLLLAFGLFTWRVPHWRVSRTSLNDLTPGQCFSPGLINTSASCARCVHFVTVANLMDRWSGAKRLAQGLRVTVGALRASQRCFNLSAYTDAARDSRAWRELAAAGGEAVTILPYPDDLPRNSYSGRNSDRNAWIELSRRKLDLLERHELQVGHKAIWTDIDTIIVADLACVYGRAPNFVVSRPYPEHSLKGPNGEVVLLDKRRSVYGDLFMLDSKLIARVRELEASGMPPPPFDLQDYFSYLLNRCDGSVVDLRAMVRGEGFMKGGKTCFGFDFAQGHYPSPKFSRLAVTNGTLQCAMEAAGGGVEYHPVGAMSFTAKTFWNMLDAPQGIFSTAELRKWAKGIGISVR